MIPTLKTLPTVSGQESGVSNSSKAQGSSGSEGNGKAFGDILNNQESSTKASADSKHTKAQESDGGNKLHENGKQLPGDEANSSPNTTASSQTSSDTDHSDDITHEPSIKEPAQESTVGLTELVDDLTITHQRADWVQQFAGKQGSSRLESKGNSIDSKANSPDVLAFSNLLDISLTEKSPLPVFPVTSVPALAAANGKAGNTSVTANIVSLDGAKIDLNTLQPGLLNSDDLAAIQQALGGDVAKEKLMLDVVPLKAMSSLQAQISSQVSVSSPTAIISNAAMAQMAETGLVSDIKAAANTMVMTSALGESGWDGEFLGRVNMLIKGGIQEAKIQLSPPEMGRLEIKVSTEGDSAKIMFSVDNIAAKDAIEQAIPRLRELLEQGGLQLAHSEVADHSQADQGQGEVDETAMGSDLAMDTEDDGEEGNSWQLGISLSNSTVDYYI